MAWVPMLKGNLREALGQMVKGWNGPDLVEGFEGRDGDIRRVRSDWSRNDGRRRRIEISYLKSGSKKITFAPLPKQAEA